MGKKFFKFKLSIAILTCCIFSIYWIKSIYSSENKEESKNNAKIIIAHSEIFGKSERPQVIFDHGLHTEALREEDCGICHSTDEKNHLIFEYLSQEFKKSKKSLMDFYHDTCINCHKEMLEEGKKAGSITCGGCHIKEFESKKIGHQAFEFDFYYHNKHVNALKDDCSLCHHIYIEDTKELIYEKGTEQSCIYCHQDNNNFSLEKVSHYKCINCHIDKSKEGIKSGPFDCQKCHSEENIRTVEELLDVPRPDRGQSEKIVIKIDDARMMEVPFNHKYHEKNTKGCRTCHHKTLSACKKCHTQEGSTEGERINIANAYHDVFSELSCIGCHEFKKPDKFCAGCHHLQKIDQHDEENCLICHIGPKEKVIVSPRISESELPSEKIPEKVEIKILEKEYESVLFPHRDIIRKLIEISNESKLASYFHKNLQTICQGCHHHGPVELEKGVPACNTCHSSYLTSKRADVPGLLGAYHRQCLGCHEVMKVGPTDCTGCHPKKEEKNIIKGSVQ